jgi:ribosome-associated translation inhibitor RaiA
MMANSNAKTQQQSYTTGTPPPGAGWTPVPDPTLLSTQLVEKANANLKELVQAEIKATRDVIEARLDGNDKAIELLQQASDKINVMISAEVERLQELHEEKFQSVSVQFKERDTRAEQASKDSKTAIDAALQAQKESVSKTEGTFTKQFDQIGILITAGTKSTEGQISDLKERISVIESHGKGVSDSWSWLLGGVGLIFSLMGIAAAMFAVLK